MIALLACTPSEDTAGPPDSAHESAHVDTSDTDDTHDTHDTHDTDTAPMPLGFPGLAELGVRNIVVLHIDTLRADHLPWYGYARDTMPLAQSRSWMVVDDVYATASWTLPSTASFFTAMDVQHHGVSHTDSSGVIVPYDDLSVATHLQGQGYATLFGSGNKALLSAGGYDVGFDEMLDIGESGEAVDLARLLPDTFAWIDEQDRPFFVVLQPMDLHAPYDPGEPYLGTWSTDIPFETNADVGEQYDQIYRAWAAALSEEERVAVLDQVRAVYDEDLLGLDNAVDVLMDGLHSRDLMRDTLVVLVGDHGETIGEDPSQMTVGHGGTTRRELVRVPLMFHHPRLPSQGITCLSQNTDTMPTVLAALGLTPMPDTDGHPLQDGCRTVVAASTFQSDLWQALPGELMVTDGRYALRWNCVEKAIYQHDYEADPAGIEEAATWPSDGVLEGAMEAFQQALTDGVESERCEN